MSLVGGSASRRGSVSVRQSSPVLVSYEQIVNCVFESIKSNQVGIEDFEKAIESVRLHLQAELPTPTTACASPVIKHRGRSYSTGKVTVSLTLDDFICETVPTPKSERRPSSIVGSINHQQQQQHMLTALPPPPPPQIPPPQNRKSPRRPLAPSLRLADIALGDIIGKGAMGTVYRAMIKVTGEQIAVKVVLKEAAGDEAALIEALDNELTILQNLDHPRIVRYLGHELESDKLVIFCEYLPGGSISSAIRQFGAFEEETISAHVRQILEGLKYLHENRIIHRDLKAANCLLDLSGAVRLADFGCSKKIENLGGSTVIMKTMKGSIPWMAPEVIMGEGYGRAADIWAVGCCVVEMATGKHPWAGRLDNVLQAMYRIAMCDEHLDIPPKLSPNCQDFIQKCTNRNPKLRPTAAELLNHPFVTNHR
jgi:tRNA A-37 threonylcarbamoyl transferase component Bud32